MAEVSEQAAHPVGVRADFEYEPGRRCALEVPGKSLGRGRDARLLDDLAGFVQHTDLGVAIAKVQPHYHSAFELVGGRFLHGQPPSKWPTGPSPDWVI